MINLKFVPLTIFFFSLWCSVSNAQTQDVTNYNGDFTNSNYGQVTEYDIENWHLIAFNIPDSAGMFSIVDDPEANQTKALKTTLQELGDEVFPWNVMAVNSNFKLIPGARYSFSIRMRATDSAKVGLLVENLHHLVLPNTDTLFTIGNEWKEYVFEFVNDTLNGEVITSGNASILMGYEENENTSIFIDDLRITNLNPELDVPVEIENPTNPNGDFEAPEQKVVVQGWTLFADESAQATFALIEDSTNASNNVVSVAIDSIGDQIWGILFDSFPSVIELQPDTDYRLIVRAKADSVGKIRVFGSAGDNLLLQDTTLTDQWNTFTFPLPRFEWVEDFKLLLMMNFEENEGETLYFDRISIVNDQDLQVNENGDFSSAHSELLWPGWGLTVLNDPMISMHASTEAYSGNYAMRVDLGNIARYQPFGPSAINKYFHIEPQAEYQFSTWLKSDVNGPTVEFRVTNELHSFERLSGPVISSTEWQEVSFRFTNPTNYGEDNAMNFVEVKFGSEDNLQFGAYSMFIDDVSVARIRPSKQSQTNTEESNLGNLPNTFNLEQNYPNPFNPSTTIRYQLPERSLVSLKVFDMLGREVAELVNETVQAGSHEARFDASQLASGIYIYRLQAGSFVQTKQMVLIK